MSIVWAASVEAYRRIIAEKKHIRDALEGELAALGPPSAAIWYIKNQLFNINRQIEDLEEWLKKLEEKGG